MCELFSVERQNETTNLRVGIHILPRFKGTEREEVPREEQLVKRARRHPRPRRRPRLSSTVQSGREGGRCYVRVSGVWAVAVALGRLRRWGGTREKEEGNARPTNARPFMFDLGGTVNLSRRQVSN